MVTLYEGRRLGTVPVPPTANVSAAAQRFRAGWPGRTMSWVIHDPDMDLSWLTRLATLQFWTFKPAGFPW